MSIRCVEAATDPRWGPVLAAHSSWGPKRSAVAVLVESSTSTDEQTALFDGPLDMVFPWASVTKLLTTLACLVALEEHTIQLDDFIDLSDLTGRSPEHTESPPAPFTLAMLLSHAAGIHTERLEPVSAPLRRRLYSNAGIRLAALHLERRSGMLFNNYCREAVVDPLRMDSVVLTDPAAGASGSLRDLIALTAELQRPTIVTAKTLTIATRPQFPELSGTLPGFGFQEDNLWGIGFEIRGEKIPHWTGQNNSSSTFGHFGQSGSMLWVDRPNRVATCALASDPFGPWAVLSWPNFADSVLAMSSRVARGAI